jgi:putative ATPase
VLILEARSLLWALDPLAATPEGGVVIQAASADDAERLTAQLQVLDSLRQPRLLNELEPGEQFEWIAARHPFRHGNAAELNQQLDALTALASPKAELRFLFSRPQLGPAGALLAMAQTSTTNRELLAQVAPLEWDWLATAPEPLELEQLLAQRGWQVQSQHWGERLELEVTVGLVERWFSCDAPYRLQLHQLLPEGEIETLAQQLQDRVGQRIPQELGHHLFIAKRQKAPA